MFDSWNTVSRASILILHQIDNCHGSAQRISFAEFNIRIDKRYIVQRENYNTKYMCVHVIKILY